MGSKVERLNGILSVLKQRNGCTVKELATRFSVSEMTIRRDLNFLNQNQVISNVYGAAIYNPNNEASRIEADYSLSKAQSSNHQEKMAIGKLAASLIEQTDSIILDTGTTTEALANYIEQDVEILCYNMNIMNTLMIQDKTKITFAGGYYHNNTQMCEGPESLALIRAKRATKVFVSAAGIHSQLGITCAENYEISTKKAIIECAVRKILVVDSGKFGKVCQSYFADLNQFDDIVTDAGISQSWITQIQEAGIALHLAT